MVVDFLLYEIMFSMVFGIEVLVTLFVFFVYFFICFLKFEFIGEFSVSY